jgi:hypothetical protein
VIHKEFVPEGKTVNSESYVQMMERLLKQILRVRPQFLMSWFFLHDNGPTHCAMTEEHFLANLCGGESHPPY